MINTLSQPLYSARDHNRIPLVTRRKSVRISTSLVQSLCNCERHSQERTEPAAAKEEPEEEVALVEEDPREHLNVVFIGHVDAGKSTLSGNMLYLTGFVDKRTIEKYEREAKQRRELRARAAGRVPAAGPPDLLRVDSLLPVVADSTDRPSSRTGLAPPSLLTLTTVLM